mmetsp:Transcript_26813/g.50076  ORF Transcript_26813/g.50076 Transcript_26813/m.50076 type:complete len:282 (+) Transcript_26813:992-1837(+)
MDWYCFGSLMRISALLDSDLSSSSTFSRQILGFLNCLGACSKPAYENVFLNATPSTMKESVVDPPGTFLMPTIPRSRAISLSRCITASTAMEAKNSFCLAISFEFKAVLAQRSRSSLNFLGSFLSTLIAISSILARAMAEAFLKPLIMTWGCTPSSMKPLTFFRSSPASTTTEVVPSPTMSSWLFAMSTRVPAAGCTMSNRLITVAPSLEIVTFEPTWISLSIPRGPRVVFTMSTTALQALMLLSNWPLPWEVSVPSLRRTILGFRRWLMLVMCFWSPGDG